MFTRTCWAGFEVKPMWSHVIRPHHFCRHPLNDLPVHQSLISWFKAIELIWILYSDRPPNKWYFIYVHINLQTARSGVPFFVNQHFPKNRGWHCCPSLLQYHCLTLPRNIFWSHDPLWWEVPVFWANKWARLTILALSFQIYIYERMNPNYQIKYQHSMSWC